MRIATKYEVGNVYTAKSGCMFKIVEKLPNGHRKIKFLDEFGYEYCVSISAIKKNSIKNIFYRDFEDIGYLGIDYKDYPKILRNRWRAILHRCYNKNRLKLFPTYKNVSVCEEWHNFSNFAKWFDENYPYHISDIKFQLDKDLLQQGIENKVYSSETCLFLPEKVNYFIISKRKLGSSGLIGAFWNKVNKKWQSNIMDFTEGKIKYLGLYDTKEEASNAYQKARVLEAEKVKYYLKNLNYLQDGIINLIK